MKKRGAFVIAGAGKGLSVVLSERALREGYSLALVGRTEETLNALASELKERNAETVVSTHVADLSDSDQTQRAFEDIIKKHGRVEVLINNAATWTGGKKVSELSSNDFRNALDLNFFTILNPILEVLKRSSEKGKENLTILGMGATASHRGNKNVSAFAVPKSASRILLQSLAKELGPEGVHVCHLTIDGLIDNDRTRKLNEGRDDDKYIKMSDLSETIINIVRQPKSCWTFELDVRPFNETWT